MVADLVDRTVRLFLAALFVLGAAGLPDCCRGDGPGRAADLGTGDACVWGLNPVCTPAEDMP